jgi:hypothetical protein
VFDHGAAGKHRSVDGIVRVGVHQRAQPERLGLAADGLNLFVGQGFRSVFTDALGGEDLDEIRSLLFALANLARASDPGLHCIRLARRAKFTRAGREGCPAPRLRVDLCQPWRRALQRRKSGV